jgi:hypothetical protein
MAEVLVSGLLHVNLEASTFISGTQASPSLGKHIQYIYSSEYICVYVLVLDCRVAK